MINVIIYSFHSRWFRAVELRKVHAAEGKKLYCFRADGDFEFDDNETYPLYRLRVLILA